MEQHAFKNVNSCWNTKITFYLETSGDETYILYLNFHFSTPVLISHLRKLKTVVFWDGCTCLSARMYVKCWSVPIDIKSLQNRLLKVCYVPATSATLPTVSFFFSFLFLLLRPLTVLMKQTRWLKQSILFGCLCQYHINKIINSCGMWPRQVWRHFHGTNCWLFHYQTLPREIWP